ncbi:hypothetical protein [Bilophila wadsworthia]|jgi:hypothetical protein|uniref:hypothetical protein n=1 Tax=Bilophila wadsworthia TaxID=35833 RepID=UPI00266CAA27|nr:hypothetical protein [Bilophila wadsworthia]
MGSEKVKSPFYGVIQQLSGKHSISMLLRIAGLSSSVFYKWRKTDSRIPLDRINELKEHIQAVTCHTPPIWLSENDMGVKAGIFFSES